MPDQKQHLTKPDIMITSGFAVLIILLVVLAFNWPSFLYWAYDRHQNLASWYVRPLFLIPYCLFAFRHSLPGIMGTILLLLTSMFWFPAPDCVPDDMRMFLQFEKNWILGEWTLSKAVLASLVPAAFILLALAFWNRSVFFGIFLLIIIAAGKVMWAVDGAGNAGKSIIVPAAAGLFFCCMLVYIGFKKLR